MSADADADPDLVLIRCEGSGALSPGWCPMCAVSVPVGEMIPEHQRLDVLVMLDRGDFDHRALTAQTPVRPMSEGSADVVPPG